MEQLDPLTGLPVQQAVQQAVQPVQAPLPPAPNYAPINPKAVSAVGTVQSVFGSNTEGQYGRQFTPNTNQI